MGHGLIPHSPGMRNWKGKLCSPAARVPVKEEVLSVTRNRKQMLMTFMGVHIMVILCV